MIRYEINFIEIGQTVGWFTYDIYADSVFDAACELFALCGSNITFNKVTEV